MHPFSFVLAGVFFFIKNYISLDLRPIALCCRLCPLSIVIVVPSSTPQPLSFVVVSSPCLSLWWHDRGGLSLGRVIDDGLDLYKPIVAKSWIRLVRATLKIVVIIPNLHFSLTPPPLLLTLLRFDHRCSMITYCKDIVTKKMKSKMITLLHISKTPHSS